MHAPNDNTAPKGQRGWWSSPPRSGMQRIIAPWEYRHLRGFARVRIAAGIVLAGLGAVTLVGGSFTKAAVWSWDSVPGVRRQQASRGPPGRWLSLVPHLPGAEPARLALAWPVRDEPASEQKAERAST